MISSKNSSKTSPSPRVRFLPWIPQALRVRLSHLTLTGRLGLLGLGAGGATCMERMNLFFPWTRRAPQGPNSAGNAPWLRVQLCGNLQLARRWSGLCTAVVSRDRQISLEIKPGRYMLGTARLGRTFGCLVTDKFAGGACVWSVELQQRSCMGLGR